MTSGQFPASHAPTTVVMPHPLAASTPAHSTTPDLSGVIDGVSTHIAVIPSGDDQSGIIVKAGGPTWGTHSLSPGGDPNYGKGQFISFHKWGTGLLDNPNNTLLFRVDKTGGIGCTGGMHLATGLRQDAGYSVTQALWIQPSIDTTHIAFTGYSGQTLPFLYATDSVGSLKFEVFASGAVQSATEIAARIGQSTQVAMGNISGFPAIQFGNDLTTFLARTSNPTYLQVTNHLQAVGELIAEVNQTDKQVVIGTMFGSLAGIGFGTVLDTVAWREFPGMLAVADNLHVKNISHPTVAVVTLQNAAGQTGKAIRGLNSAGTEIWSIDANGILSTVGGAFPPSSGNWTMKDSLTVQNNGSTSNTVLAAVGVSGQSGYLIAGVQNTGGVVFSVTNAGAVAAASTVTCSAVSATGGTSFFGAISVSSVASSGAGQFTSLSLSSSISGATSIAGTSLNVGTGTVTCGQVSATNGTSFFAAISVSSVASSGGIQATSFTASSSSSSLRGINNNSQGITSCGSIAGATTISASSTITGTAFSATSGTSFFQGIVGTTLAISGAKMFVIEHPLDPDRALAHACIEGPEFGVYQRGRAQIGADGSVVVKLPDYWEALVRPDNRSVQLTLVHDPEIAPGPVAASEPVDGSFIIVGTPGAQVWWLVTAVRGDIDPLGVEWLKSDEYWFDERPVIEEPPPFDDTQARKDAHDQLAGMAPWVEQPEEETAR